MSMVDHEKTYQFLTNWWEIPDPAGSYGDTAHVAAIAKNVLLKIKNTLIGVASSPWIVESCSDSSVAGNNDQVDRWNDIGDMVNNTAGSPHSWIVLRHGGGLPNECSILFDMSNNNSTFAIMTVVVSPHAGFGAVNGGTDGTTTARPTAADEHVILNNTTWWTSAGVNNVTKQVLTIMQSTDGEVTRILGFTNAVNSLWIEVSAPKNPVSAWNRQVWWMYKSSSIASPVRVVTYSTANDNAVAVFRQDGIGFGTFYFSTNGVSFQAVGQRRASSPNIENIGQNSIDRGWTMTPVGLFSLSTSLRGMYGMAYDIYYAPDIQAGMSSNTSGTKRWTQVGQMLLPWDDSGGQNPVRA